MDLGIPELLIILVIVLLLFGSTRLPKLSRSIGESMRELRNGITGTDTTTKNKGAKAKAEENVPKAEENATATEGNATAVKENITEAEENTAKA